MDPRWVALALLGLAGAATAAAPAFDSGPLRTGQTFTWVAEPGTFAYHCSIHPQMRGAFRVAEADGRGQRLAVAIEDLAFDPPNASLAHGAAVIWTNRDAAAHTVTADLPPEPPAPRGLPLPWLLAPLALALGGLARRR